MALIESDLDINGAADISGTLDVAGDIALGNRFNLGDDGVMTWGNSNNYGQLNWDGSFALISGQSGKGIKFRTNGSGLALTLDTSQNATFAGKASFSTTEAPTAKIQAGPKTFGGGNGVHNDARLGIMNNGSLTSIVNASTYNDANYPDYGLVFIQGPSTSSYNVWSISPDGPAKGSDLNLLYQAQATNIHTQTPKIKFHSSGGATFAGNLLIPDDGQIGSASDPNAIAIDDSGLISISGTGVEIAGYLKIGGHEIDDIDVTSEFVDADAHIMSSKAIGARFSLKAGSTSITTLGTIGTGVWNGSVIANAYLDADTAHLSTAQTFTGSKTMGTTVKLNFRDGNSYMHSPTANDLEVVCTDFVLDAATSIALEANTTITGGALSITGDGSNAVTLTESGSGDFTVDAPGDIILDAASNDVIIKDDGTSRLTFNFTNSGHFYNVLSTADKTWGVKGIDGSAAITALSIDMANAGKATFNNDVVAFSDRKLKENIQTLDGKKVLEMRGVSFIRKDTKEQSSGVIAQEMQKVAPELVSESQGTLGVSYGNLVGYLIEAVKDQQKQIDELKELCNGCSK